MAILYHIDAIFSTRNDDQTQKNPYWFGSQWIFLLSWNIRVWNVDCSNGTKHTSEGAAKRFLQLFWEMKLILNLFTQKERNVSFSVRIINHFGDHGRMLDHFVNSTEKHTTRQSKELTFKKSRYSCHYLVINFFFNFLCIQEIILKKFKFKKKSSEKFTNTEEIDLYEGESTHSKFQAIVDNSNWEYFFSKSSMN